MKNDDIDLPVYNEEFPTDDEYSLQQGDRGSVRLDIFYSHQLVQNEEIVNQKDGIEHQYHFGKNKILDGSVTGTVYHNNNKIQSFIPAFKEFAFTAYPYDGPKVVSAKMDNEKGVLTLVWDRKIKAGEGKVIVNYEYNMA
jgi:hypothetical protein